MKQKKDRPLERTVSLRSGDNVVVRQMDWKTYKRLKSRIVQLVSENLTLENAIDFAAILKSDDPIVTGIQAIRSLGAMVMDAIDELTPVLVAGCVDRDAVPDVESLPPADILRLREACAEVNDLDELIGLEGNALAAAAQRIRALTAGVGGLESNQHLQPDTAGASLT